MKKVIKYIFSGLLTVAEVGSLIGFVFYLGVWVQMTQPETIPVTPKELKEIIIPVFFLLWTIPSVINGLRDRRWKRQGNKLETTT